MLCLLTAQPLGTGQMLKSLRDGEVDVIVALTEGLVLDVAKGSGSGSASSDSTPAAPAPVVRLLGTYVQSPLTWAISTGATSPYTTVESLRVSVKLVCLLVCVAVRLSSSSYAPVSLLRPWAYLCGCVPACLYMCCKYMCKFKPAFLHC